MGSIYFIDTFLQKNDFESSALACFSPLLEQPANTKKTKIKLRYFIQII